MYDGTTVILQAITNVIPCATYHLKLGVADASDPSYDSGVFLKAGSLNSTAITIQPIGGGGGLTAPVPYCVRGCLPGQFVFSRPDPRPTPLTIKYLIQGTATNGVDYALIPDSVIIPANQTSAVRIISGIPVTPATGPEIVKLMVLSPYTCSGGTPNIIDSAELAIYDSFYVRILTNDTAVCKYETVHIEAEGDSLLTYNWTPTSWLSTTTGKTTDASPEVTTTYAINANIPGSGCPDAHDYITITVKDEPNVDAGPDTVTCLGTPYQFNVQVTPSNQTYSYTWDPPTYLNNPTISNPISNPTADVTYVITVNSGAIGCNGYDTVTLRVLPDDFLLANNDTAICAGASVQINAIGDPAFTYTWTPTTDVSDPNILTPVITPDTSRNYTVTATFPGCPPISHGLFIDVQPNPIVNAGADREMCQFDTVQLHGLTLPTWYPNYAYSWTPGGDLSDPSQADVVFSGLATETLTLTVTTPAGCSGNDDVTVTVKPGNFGSISPAGDTAICPNETVQFTAAGGTSYQWSPGYTLTDSMIADPIAAPTTTIDYQVIIGSADGCTDTFINRVTVHPAALVELGPNQTIYPGESYPMDPDGNCMYFAWLPPVGLSATNISNPIAQPTVNTRYYATGQTEHGCTAVDSIDIIVSNTVLDMPNAFSPGSGSNNELKIIKRGIATLKYLRIFNRWGNLVFETTDIEQGWDGRLNGEIQPMGVYIYTIEAQTIDGRPFVKQGNVTLIR